MGASLGGLLCLYIDNTQLPIFYSIFWCPGAAAVDAFTVNWAGTINWWIPSVHLVGRTVKHVKECKAVGSLLVHVEVSIFLASLVSRW